MSNETTATAAEFGTYGSKYETEGRGPKTEIAKRIRADVKHAQTLPSSDPMSLPAGLKLSVRTRGYNAIDLNVTACPAAILSPAAALMLEIFPNTFSELPRYSKEGARILAVLERIMGQFNFDKSDIQSDHFHVNFYGHATYAHDLERAARAAILVEQAELIADVRVTVAAGQFGTATEQIESVSTGYHSHGWERAAVATLFN